MKRCQRSSFTSSGTAPASALAFGAFDGLVLEAADTVELGFLQPVEQELRNPPPSRPGKPTMKVERIARSGQTSRQRRMRSSVFSCARDDAWLSARRETHAERGCRDRAGFCPPPSAGSRRRRADKDRHSAGAPRRRARQAPATSRGSGLSAARPSTGSRHI